MRTLTHLALAGALALSALAPAGVATAAEKQHLKTTTYRGGWADFTYCQVDFRLPWCPYSR